MSDDSANPEVARGLTCLQTDDTANARNSAFIRKEKLAATKFDSKPPYFLDGNRPVTSNGATITRRNDVFFISQLTRTSKLSCISTDVIEKVAFTSERARSTYIAAISRPDLKFEFLVCSQYITPDANAA